MSEKKTNKSLQDKIYNFLKDNKKIIIILSIFFILSIFSFIFYGTVKDKANKKVSQQYTKATILINKKKNEESKFLLIDIIEEEHSFYSPLALFLIINNNMEKDPEKIINYFDQILKINSIDDENLNLIKIKKAFFLFDSNNEELIIKTLNPVINSDSVWRKMAVKLISDYFLSRNQPKKASEYKQLLNNK